jgi:hypothetical protein
MNNNLDCPVDHVTVNENKVRLVAFFVLLLAIALILFNSRVIAALLLVDFTLRAFNLNTYSPLGLISGVVVKQFHITNKPVDRAPKRFAAGVGLVFSAAILITLMLDLITTSKLITAVLILFAMLESVFGFCAGCYVYSILKRLQIIK